MQHSQSLRHFNTTETGVCYENVHEFISALLTNHYISRKVRNYWNNPLETGDICKDVHTVIC